MRREYKNNRLMVNASLMLQETVGVLSDPDRGAVIVASGHVSSRVASWRTRAASLRSEFVRVPSVFLSKISALMMSGGQGCCHTRIVPDPDRFGHTPAAPMPEALQNHRWVGSRQTIAARCVGLATVCATNALQSLIS